MEFSSHCEMRIELRDNECSIFAGQYIHGKLHVKETLQMTADSIILSLTGNEEVSFKRPKNRLSDGSITIPEDITSPDQI